MHVFSLLCLAPSCFKSSRLLSRASCLSLAAVGCPFGWSLAKTKHLEIKVLLLPVVTVGFEPSPEVTPLPELLPGPVKLRLGVLELLVLVLQLFVLLGR